MEDFEKLGVFYLGREVDPATNSSKDNLVLYDSKDLTTHAVCVGMTGSGKTGLCICLLEEAAIDGIPSLIIDPKGDLTNILLQFPDLRPEDFLPWINEDEATQKGMSPQDFAAKQATLWKDGLAKWGESGDRIRKLKDSAEFVVYTPGSNAGTPVSVLKSFAAPNAAIMNDSELLREKISTTATSLLSLLGMDVNPLTSREHILLSTIFDVAWKKGDLDLAQIIQQIQNPPVTRIGVMDLESFFPAKDRFQFAMSINHLLAAPGFDLWLQGDPLDIGALLHSASGKPRVSVFSIAHLSDSERMFFVSLLLNQTVGWMRTQPGTSSLRAILYMDEIFGYFPPVANPPSKQPLLTLLKQARAFGLGIVLATQNPVDLDYKGLANTGTWLIGRLQTERDKARLLDGLDGASPGQSFDRGKVEQILSGLSTRVFLMNNVHEDHPVVFETRWALSYLPGPLTRMQLQKLAKPLSDSAVVSAPTSRVISGVPPRSKGTERPVLPPEIPQMFLPIRSTEPAGSELLYVPKIWGSAKIYYADPKAGIATEDSVALLADPSEGWDNAEATDVAETDVEKSPEQSAQFGELPSQAANAKSYPVWTKGLQDSLFRTQKITLLKSAMFGQTSKPNESERDFRIRLQQQSREERDRQIEKLRQKYAAQINSLQDRINRAQMAVEREKQQASQQKLQTAISFGTTVLGALFGRKTLSTSVLGRATTAARGVGRSMKESEDVGRAQDSVESLKQQLTDLQNEVQRETDDLSSRLDPQNETFESVEVRPKKTNISVKTVALAWVPCWQDSSGKLSRA